MISSVRNPASAAEQTQSAAAQSPAVYQTPFGDVLASEVTGIDLDAWVTGGNSSVASAASTPGKDQAALRTTGTVKPTYTASAGATGTDSGSTTTGTTAASSSASTSSGTTSTTSGASGNDVPTLESVFGTGDVLAERPHRFGGWRLLELQPDLLCHPTDGGNRGPNIGRHGGGVGRHHQRAGVAPAAEPAERDGTALQRHPGQRRIGGRPI